MSVSARLTLVRLVDWGTAVPLSHQALDWLESTLAASTVAEVCALLRHARARDAEAQARAVHLQRILHQGHVPPRDPTNPMTWTLTLGGKAADTMARLEAQADHLQQATRPDVERLQIRTAVERLGVILADLPPDALVSVSVTGYARGTGDDATLYESSSVSVTSAADARGAAQRAAAYGQRETAPRDPGTPGRRMALDPSHPGGMDQPEPLDPATTNAADIARVNEATAVRATPPA